jgi:enterobacteria phage integrase
MTRLETMRIDHGYRAVAGITKDRIDTTALDTLKKLGILIKHAMEKGWLKFDPMVGIKRPKIGGQGLPGC